MPHIQRMVVDGALEIGSSESKPCALSFAVWHERPFIERQREWRETRRSARNLTGAWCGDRFKAVDDHVRSGMVVGLGTGSTAFFAVQRVGQKLRTGELSDIICIPTVGSV